MEGVGTVLALEMSSPCCFCALFLISSRRTVAVQFGLYVPFVERLVEGFCAFKHFAHTLHIGHVPFVERLVETGCAFKHYAHTPHIGHVPIIERLVEGFCFIKHTVHTCHS